jgi:hypothetical protein
MFLEAVRVFSPDLNVKASAMLNVADIRDDVAFPPSGFPDHDPLQGTDIVHSETLVHTA